MSAKPFRKALKVVALSLALAGCSSVGTINGMRMGATNAPEEASFCTQNEMFCVLAGIAILGGVVAIMQDSGGSGNGGGQSQDPD